MSAHAARFPLRAAAIDMGSNALRFLAAEFESPAHYRVLESERVPVRLGHSAFLTQCLEPELVDEAVRALRGFRSRMDALAIGPYRAAATSAVRESRNGRELTGRIRDEARIRVDIITGTEEGRLVWRAIGHRMAVGGRRWILADLGGGSVEVSLADAGRLAWTESLALGTVRMLEELGVGDDAPATTVRRLLEEYSSALRGQFHAAGTVEGMIATGGNAEALADLAGAPPDRRGGRLLTRSGLHTVLERLASLSVDERIEKLGLREDRADVILPAAIVYERLAALAGTDVILVPGVGLKEGLLLDLVDELAAHEGYEHRRAQEVQEAALAVGRRYDLEEAHARHVTGLALQLFDELRELHGMDDAERRLLIAAGLLHDVGQYVAYHKHHKHSRYLILHSEPRGLTPREIGMASLVARYHRRAEPKATHEGYAELPPADRQVVEKLAALLRVADALDREHRQQVESMAIETDGGCVTLRLRGRGDVLLEQWSVRKKGRLFERVFNRKLKIEYEEQR